MTTIRTRPEPESAESRRVQEEIRAASGLRQLAALRRRYPDVAEAWLESAFALDRLGREDEAIPLYEQAIRLGLDGSALRDALICLGSSLRTVGRAREALRRFQQARRRFPRDVVVELFLALGYHDTRQPTDALRLTALACLRESGDSGLAPFRDVLKRKFRTLGKNGHATARSGL
ncbi:MAG: tetratricopeptide repeat protein [Tepidisphaeraceae bacterium]|jgi:cyanophycin synthetase